MEPREFTALLELIGSWTVLYVPFDVHEAFGSRGYVKVKGTIDGYAIAGMNLMPLNEQHRPGDGTHLLAVKEGIRKAIGKKQGQAVTVVLEPDLSALAIPEDLAATLDFLPDAKTFFDSLTESQQRYFVKWIEEAKTLPTRHSRIEKSIEMLEAKKKMYEPKW